MKGIIKNAVITFVALIAITASVPAQEEFARTPELPQGCERLGVDTHKNKLVMSTYAIGVQVYRWNGNSWDFVAPIANLYADRDFQYQLATHYAGPTWEANGGSKVVGRRLEGCSPEPTAIPWLLLEATSTDRGGIFHKASFIQRINTAGGMAPSAPGETIGQEARVPYSTEYYFYRSKGR